MFLTISGLAIGLISLGVAVFGGGTIIAIGANESREQQKKEAQQNIDTLKNKIANFENLKTSINSYLDKATGAINDLEAARKFFKDGGHVLGDVPLANDKITKCVSVLNNTKTYLNNSLTDIEYNISVCENQIKENEKLL